MKNVYLLNYSVKGIKSLDKLIQLSFYKQNITRNIDTEMYNVKGIYGMNGSGKSAIVNSIDILRNLILNPDYLNDPIIQKYLNSIINKKEKSLFIEINYLMKKYDKYFLLGYNIRLKKNQFQKYIIDEESLYLRKRYSQSDNKKDIYIVKQGSLEYINKSIIKDNERLEIEFKTLNLLETATLSALVNERILVYFKKNMDNHNFYDYLNMHIEFGSKLFAYLDNSDNHRNYISNRYLKNYDDDVVDEHTVYSALNNMVNIYQNDLCNLSISRYIVPKELYSNFELEVKQLYHFIRLFKMNLKSIEIEKRENQDVWICDLIMNYDLYKIHVEYESTGIKKLVRLFAYLKKMVDGNIVFIDELDSNLHDVYLCSLLEYLMDYGQGQLCFTTHNVGPMEILRHRKNSLDFISENHEVVSWIKNGNYSPINLYRNGMISGCPFNVDSIDFIRVFGTGRQSD